MQSDWFVPAPDKGERKPLDASDFPHDISASIAEQEDKFTFSDERLPYDSWLTLIGTDQGFDKKPTVVSSADLDDAISGGAIEMFRGVIPNKSTGESAESVADKFTRGAYEPGLGIYGNGYYTSVSRDVAEVYATRTLTPSGSIGKTKRGTVTRMALKPDARVIDYDDLVYLMYRYHDKQDVPKHIRLAVAADPGRFAAMLGYDAVKISNANDGAPPTKGRPVIYVRGGVRRSAEDQYIILNRDSVLVDGGE
jgi:hypothetical protein